MNSSSCPVMLFGAALTLSMFLSIQTAAQGADSLRVSDTRSIPSMPGNYSKSLKVNFKYNGAIGLSSAENYAAVLGLRAWTADNSGGKAFELAFTSDNVYLRSGYTAGWGSWKRLLTDENIRELSNGNIGIGTSTPQSKLAVNGTITATQVKVTQTGWPDYVFDTAYRLPALKEISDFIERYKHLPQMPSANEIRNQGLDLGDMQQKQMQKIEEMTLYLIKMKEEMSQLKEEVGQLKLSNEKLKKQVEDLKSKKP